MAFGTQDLLVLFLSSVMAPPISVHSFCVPSGIKTIGIKALCLGGKVDRM